jgi:serine/threonine protein kinase
MSGRRIADVDLAKRVEDGKERRPTESSRFGAALASPRGVLIAIPLLVLFVGASLTLVGQRALEDTSLSMARDRFVEQSTFASERLGFALLRADNVLDRISEVQRERTSNQPADEFALMMRDLIVGRAGMTQVYVGYPDGTFQGVYVTDDGSLRYQESRVGEGGGKFRHHRFAAKRLMWDRDEPTDYDPRKRTWWKVALKEDKRAWTEPYPFFTGNRTGVTRVEPIYGPGGRLHSVMAVDFDVSALSEFMARVESPDVHSLVYTDDGVVLAYPRAAAQIAKLKPTNHALNYRDVSDPLLSAFFRELPTLRNDLEGGFAPFQAENQAMLATIAPVGGDKGPGWHMAVLVSEQAFLRALTTHRRQSLLVAAGALFVSVLAAWVFARHLVRARRAVAAARAEADRATREAKELGSYTLLDCLGKGGMGEVWRAEHRLLAREAAIKLISGELAGASDMEQIQERFKREAQTIAALRSRNTVELFDYGVTDDGTFFFVMELLDGIDLESLTEKYGPQPASRVVEILVQACNSLAEAHDAGLVHRDIKPANIFICRAADEVDVVKVLDFGLVLAPARGVNEGTALPAARTVPDASASSVPMTSEVRLTAQGSYLGTPTFMPPEQAIGLEVDARADIYSLGCVAWWLLTGRLVFPANDAMAAITAHMTQPPPPLKPLVSGALPAELERLVLQCLSKNPSERPQSAREFARSLRAVEFEPSDVWTSERGQAFWRELPIRRPKSSLSPAKSGIGTMDTILSAQKPTIPRQRPA